MLKGSTSYYIRKKYPSLKKYKSFWSPSYFCETIGNMSEIVIRKYIKNQKINVKSSYKYIFMLNVDKIIKQPSTVMMKYVKKRKKEEKLFKHNIIL